MESATPDIARYFEDMRVRLGVIDQTKKEIDRLIAPDFNLFSILWSDEVRLSNMIACLLNPSESHGQGHIFLNAFLDMLKEYNTSISTASKKITDFQLAWANSKNIKSEVEQSTGMIESSQRRMDILVRGDGYGLMIENKPWASDQKDQLKAYRDELSLRFPDKHIMIYLSGNGTPPSEYSLSKKNQDAFEQNGELLVIAYDPHLVNWLQRCFDLSEADRVRWVIKDFIAYIKTTFPIYITNQTEAQ